MGGTSAAAAPAAAAPAGNAEFTTSELATLKAEGMDPADYSSRMKRSLALEPEGAFQFKTFRSAKRHVRDFRVAIAL